MYGALHPAAMREILLTSIRKGKHSVVIRWKGQQMTANACLAKLLQQTKIEYQHALRWCYVWIIHYRISRVKYFIIFRVYYDTEHWLLGASSSSSGGYSFHIFSQVTGLHMQVRTPLVACFFPDKRIFLSANQTSLVAFFFFLKNVAHLCIHAFHQETLPNTW